MEKPIYWILETPLPQLVEYQFFKKLLKNVLHLKKQLNDGHYIFPDSYSDLGKIWYDINMKN